ncbi:hypothetical protein CEXT_505441 [Caerostris extrusa]|uniref:Uncharacterized protein n=1 Tax=Caerostris extrusa TaxID=172846 RepID=A0AAV4V2R6_CAEEX|nr:hypothetical protein CEXT_505441 [Caerostris extrusa]
MAFQLPIVNATGYLQLPMLLPSNYQLPMLQNNYLSITNYQCYKTITIQLPVLRVNYLSKSNTTGQIPSNYRLLILQDYYLPITNATGQLLCKSITSATELPFNFQCKDKYLHHYYLCNATRLLPSNYQFPITNATGQLPSNYQCYYFPITNYQCYRIITFQLLITNTTGQLPSNYRLPVTNAAGQNNATEQFQLPFINYLQNYLPECRTFTLNIVFWKDR